MEKTIKTVAKRIKHLSQKREILSHVLKKSDKKKITKFKVPIKKIDLDNLTICGVDGGFLKKEYHGAGIMLRRAVGACFRYEKNKLANVAYIPSIKPIPEPIIVGPEFSDMEFGQLASLKRVEKELLVTIVTIKKKDPDVVVLDGSIVPYPSNIPDKDSDVYCTYKYVLKLFRKLYQLCTKKKILLVGAVEDSRGCRYCKVLLKKAVPSLLKADIPKKFKTKIKENKDILNNTTDTLFLYYLLDVGERTAAISYTSKENIPGSKGLKKWTKAIHAIYIKAVPFDRPLRLDFLATKNIEKTADKIASIIWQISKHNRLYSYPSVLIEADARAKLTESEIAHFKAALNEKLGRNPSLFDLRREMRPF
ncbi:hypothetical protein GF374_00935 [Candidatus Woesearchaeota archaeon]|nr:hypothetical protein [Candidatus Woesearchaeota archaeon]